ncbi:MAG: VIT and VWA domain-containing protein [Syntrophales bacterium]|nr:VIT and VWA domain-containing protein [Syntrophales bacterium]
MYYNAHAYDIGLPSVDGSNVPLQSVDVNSALNNLICETTVRQSYKNVEDKNIEAVYTFSIPLHAVFMNLEVTIGERVLKGIVVEKSEAVDRYEDAVTEGNAAIMLEQTELGLYAMNVGNLMPGEEAVISFTYVELHHWQGNSLRFFLPTTIAPRYGNPEAAGLEPHQTPEYSLVIENLFNLKLSVMGFLKDASFGSLSHNIVVNKDTDETTITLSGIEALGVRDVVVRTRFNPDVDKDIDHPTTTISSGEPFMDRDFVLNIEFDSDKKSFSMSDRDIDGYVLFASFNPRFDAGENTSARSVKVVVDCSGSMSGDSITKARGALLKILDMLRPQDYFNLVTFGNNYKMLFNEQVKAEGENLVRAKRYARHIDANMGGTEMGSAITAAIHSLSPQDISTEIFLITDGEVWESKTIIETARKSNHRIFTVGVGSSVSEGFVRAIAEETGGACELVSPMEEMEGKIVRHFKRIYLPKATDIKIRWPEGATKMIPEKIKAVYDGDTVYAFARFPEKPAGSVRMDISTEKGHAFSEEVKIAQGAEISTDNIPGTIARLAAHEEMMEQTDAKNGLDIAVRYQLMSEYTNCLVIDARADGEKAKDLPGGTGSVICESCSPPMDYGRAKAMFSLATEETEDIPLTDFIKELAHYFDDDQGEDKPLPTIEMFKNVGLDEKIARGLTGLIERYTEESIVVSFLYALSKKRFGLLIPRHVKRIIRRQYNKGICDPDLDKEVRKIVKKTYSAKTAV